MVYLWCLWLVGSVVQVGVCGHVLARISHFQDKRRLSVSLYRLSTSILPVAFSSPYSRNCTSLATRGGNHLTRVDRAVELEEVNLKDAALHCTWTKAVNTIIQGGVAIVDYPVEPTSRQALDFDPFIWVLAVYVDDTASMLSGLVTRSQLEANVDPRVHVDE
ncbi:hypothetical protein CHS0354_035452 [Potamilus streckersoni]|uniref:Uncharacterized protein n=1 Tax=Potamilus streckersoni TaxID=2493646 RepID=A0AAE0TEI7_9BIVA|nr:hypothetical protein CHS0354_035452 [Potamilus streckersoni]